jgi:hypothetical protein
MSFKGFMSEIGAAFQSIGTYLEPFILSFLKKDAKAALDIAIEIVPQVAKTLLGASSTDKNAESKKQILAGLAAQGITAIKKSTLDNAIQVAGELTGSFSEKLISTT